MTDVGVVAVMSKCQGDRLPCPGFTRFTLHTWQTLGCKPILSQPWMKHMGYNSLACPETPLQLPHKSHYHPRTSSGAEQHSSIDSNNLLSQFRTFQIGCLLSWPQLEFQSKLWSTWCTSKLTNCVYQASAKPASNREAQWASCWGWWRKWNGHSVWQDKLLFSLPALISSH